MAASSGPRRLLTAIALLGATFLGAASFFPEALASHATATLVHATATGARATGTTFPADGAPSGAEAAGLAPYHFLPESRLEVLTHRSGFLSFMFGEDHRIRAGSFEGLVVYDRLLPRRATVDVRVPVGNLVVLTPADSADQAEIRRRMLDEVLRASEHPEILFQSTNVEPVAGTLLVEGRLTMAGTSRHVVVGMTPQLRGDTLLAQGRFSVRLSDYEMERPGVAWGTVKVADQVDIDLYVRALRGDVVLPGDAASRAGGP